MTDIKFDDHSRTRIVSYLRDCYTKTTDNINVTKLRNLHCLNTFAYSAPADVFYGHKKTGLSHALPTGSTGLSESTEALLTCGLVDKPF